MPPFPSRDVVQLQLGLLDLYETLLDGPGWDEGKVNAALKAAMLSAVALFRVQQSMGSQIASAQRELIREYRTRLEAWLAEHPRTSDDASAPPGSPAGNGPGPAARGVPR
jgi:hypothetical protein